MNFLRNLFARPASVPLHDNAEAVEAVDHLVRYARLWVRGGYLSRADIVDSVLAMAEDEGLEPDLFDAEGLVAREIAELKSEQMRWSAVTDWDRMDAALEALDMNGIVARSDFTCCGNCGMAEIGAELDRWEARGTRARGYTFFHQQDTESAVEGSGLYFNYGSSRSDDARDHAAIARELVGALEGAGFKPSWNGDLSQRVFLPLDWKRRWSER